MDDERRFRAGGWYAWARAVALVGISAGGVWSLPATAREGDLVIAALWVAALLWIWWLALWGVWQVTLSGDGVIEFRSIARRWVTHTSQLRLIRPVLLGHALEFRGDDGRVFVLGEVRDLDALTDLICERNPKVARLR